MKPEALAWIEDQKSDLVAAAIVNTPSQQVTKSQLQTLLTVAQDEPIDVLKSHLRYQMGRSQQAWRDWEAGERILTMLEQEVRERCKAAIDSGVLSKPTARDRRALQQRLAALMIGFVIREHTYQQALAAPRGNQVGNQDTRRPQHHGVRR